MPDTFTRACTAFLAMAFTLGAPPLLAQRVGGTVKDGDSGTPVADASVVLLDEDGRIQRGTLTDADGTFALDAPEEGKYKLRIGAAGYVTRDTPEFSLAEGTSSQIDILLDSEGRTGPPAGFYERMRRGEGEFLTREDIERLGSDRFTDVLRFTPSVKVIPMPDGARMDAQTAVHMNPTIYTRRSDEMLFSAEHYFTVRIKAGRDFRQRVVGAVQQGESVDECVPVLWVDGLWWGPIDHASPVGPDAALIPSDLDAIEIYNHISIVPDQFNSGRDAMCGVIVVWTKQESER